MLIYPFRLVFGRVLPAWAACTFICEYFTMFAIILQRIKLTVFSHHRRQRSLTLC